MRKVEKPWGHEEIWAETPRYAGKILHIRAGRRLSLQHHEHKDETLRVLSGVLLLELEDEHGAMRALRLEAADTARIEPLRRHRMCAIEDCELIEVSSPELDDVVRHDDDYGRTGSAP
jgi:mannose-6-phosphate isomerase-like protein (cupin superfamily)